MERPDRQGITIYLGRTDVQPNGRGPIAIQPVEFNGKRLPTSSVPSDIDAKLGPIFRLLVDGAKSVSSFASSDVYRLTFSAAATKALENGELVRVATRGGLRAWAADPQSGRIVEQAILKPAHLPMGITALGLAWQVAATITAQKYLAAINQQLAFLTIKLEDIHTRLKEESLGSLLGDIEYLKSRAEIISSKLLDNTEAHVMIYQLENIARDCSKAAVFGRRVLERLASSTYEFKYGSDGTMKPETKEWVNRYFDEVEEAARSLILSLLARVLAVEQTLILNPGSSLAESQSKAVATDLGLCEELVKMAFENVGKKAREKRKNVSVELSAAQIRLDEARKKTGFWASVECSGAESDVERFKKALVEAKEFERLCATHQASIYEAIHETKSALETANHISKRKPADIGLTVIVQVDGGRTKILEITDPQDMARRVV